MIYKTFLWKLFNFNTNSCDKKDRNILRYRSYNLIIIEDRTTFTFVLRNLEPRTKSAEVQHFYDFFFFLFYQYGESYVFPRILCYATILLQTLLLGLLQENDNHVLIHCQLKAKGISLDKLYLKLHMLCTVPLNFLVK